MKQMHMAESVLNRILNFVDELETPPLDPTGAGAAIDEALGTPTADMPPAEGIDAALIEKGLGLAPHS